MAENKPKKRVEQLVFRDELTNVFNRRYLYQYLPEEISRTKSSGGNMWFFMIDIDDFKLINDKYGHLAGDEVLKTVAEIISECVRSEDTVVRYAGDEFTVILPGGSLTESLNIAKKISKAISGNKFNLKSAQVSLKINLSIGIANYPDDAQDTLRLIDLADKALYVSKEKGKNRISLVTDISREILREREILERFPCPALIEREEQLSQLKASFDDSKSNDNFGLSVIEGESGVGKSRLLNEFSNLLTSEGITCNLLSCSEKFTEQSYRYILIALDGLFQNVTFDKELTLKNLTNMHQAVLGEILKSFQKTFEIPTESIENCSNEEREQLASEGILKLLVNISQQRKFCIFLDNFHLIDEKSIKLISALKQEACHVFFCVVFEKSDLYSSEETELPLSKNYDSFSECIDLDIRLQPLTNNGTSQMISTILENVDIPKEFDELLHKSTNGNPLFTEELLKFFIQKGILYAQKGKWQTVDIDEIEIPDSLEQVIQQRIQSLDKSAQELIAKAAVIGQDFNADLLHRLGKEDESYVLDILESAKRAGLIKNKITPYGEEMSFVSQEIRKTLYNLMERDETKDLHQQLGQIQEGLHSNKLDNVASELYYHFKKAEDYHRATEYAKKIKESDGLVYDRAIQYAKELLSEEAEERKLVPLNKKSLELLPDLIRLFYIVNINYTLYPNDSEMIQSPIEQIYKSITQVFAWDEFLVFSEVKGTLVVNGERIKGIEIKKLFENAFINLLKTYHLESLTFKRGLTIQELAIFLENIGKIPEDAAISEFYKSKDVVNIEVNEINYDTLSKPKKTEERSKLEDVMLMDYLVGKLTGTDEKSPDIYSKLDSHSNEVADAISKIGEMVADGKVVNIEAKVSPDVAENIVSDIKKGVDKDKSKQKKSSPAKPGKIVVPQKIDQKQTLQAEVVAKSLQKLGNEIFEKKPNDWGKYKKGLAKTILNLEPRLREQVLLSSGKSALSEKKDIIKELIPEFPDEVILDLIANEFKKTDLSVVKVRHLVDKFLIDPKQKARIFPGLKSKLTRGEGFSTEDLSWIFGEKLWSDFSLEERVNKFSKLAAADFVELEKEININSLIIEIISEGKQDYLKRILEKWKNLLRARATSTIHQQIVKSFTKIIDLIPSARDDFLGGLSDFLFNEFRQQMDVDIYVQIVQHLAKSCEDLIEKKNFVSSTNIIKKLKKEQSLEKILDSQKKLIKESLKNILQIKKIKIIVDELIKRIDNNIYYTDIVHLILEMQGPAVVNLLIEKAMVDEKILSSLGYFGAFLRKRTVGEILVDYIKLNGKVEVENEIQLRLKDEKVFIVNDAIEMITYLKDTQMAKCLEPLLHHKDNSVRRKMVFALRKLGGRESIDVLIKALSDGEKLVRNNTIRALGNVGDDLAIEALEQFSEKKETESIALDAIEKIKKRAQ